MKYLIITLIVFGVNLLPAFGPPTWTLLVFAKIEWNLQPVLLVVCGAFAAGSGRYLLAHASHALQGHLPKRLRKNLSEAQERLTSRRHGVLLTLGLFVISPLPSAQLFVAAGLLNVPLLSLTLGFFAGRLVTYSLYVSAATLAQHQLGSVLAHVWGSPWSIALQIALTLIVVALPFRSWRAKGVPEGTEPHPST